MCNPNSHLNECHQRVSSTCLRMFVISSLGFKGNLSLLDIFAHFFQGAYSQMEGLSAPSARQVFEASPGQSLGLGDQGQEGRQDHLAAPPESFFFQTDGFGARDETSESVRFGMGSRPTADGALEAPSYLGVRPSRL